MTKWTDLSILFWTFCIICQAKSSELHWKSVPKTHSSNSWQGERDLVTKCEVCHLLDNSICKTTKIAMLIWSPQSIHPPRYSKIVLSFWKGVVMAVTATTLKAVATHSESYVQHIGTQCIFLEFHIFIVVLTGKNSILYWCIRKAFIITSGQVISTLFLSPRSQKAKRQS